MSRRHAILKEVGNRFDESREKSLKEKQYVKKLNCTSKNTDARVDFLCMSVSTPVTKKMKVKYKRSRSIWHFLKCWQSGKMAEINCQKAISTNLLVVIRAKTEKATRQLFRPGSPTDYPRQQSMESRNTSKRSICKVQLY